MAWPNLSSDTIRIPSFCNAKSIGFGAMCYPVIALYNLYMERQ